MRDKVYENRVGGWQGDDEQYVEDLCLKATKVLSPEAGPCLSIKSIANYVNQFLKYPIANAKVGRITTNLGFIKAHHNDGRYVVLI